MDWETHCELPFNFLFHMIPLNRVVEVGNAPVIHITTITTILASFVQIISSQLQLIA